MSDSSLPGFALRFLRAMGHALRPVIQIGKDGETAGLVEATRLALLDHELVKVKVLTDAPVERHDVAASLAKATDSVLAQVVGRTFLLYRRHPQTPRIQVPKKMSPTKRAAQKARESDAAAKSEGAPREAGPSDVRRAGPKKAAAAAGEGAPAARGARRAYSSHMKGTSRRNRRGQR